MNKLISNRHLNVAFALRDSIDVSNVKNVADTTLLQIRKEPFLKQPLNILLLYRNHSMRQEQFTNSIQYFQFTKIIYIIFGDFNINALEQSNYLS